MKSLSTTQLAVLRQHKLLPDSPGSDVVAADTQAGVDLLSILASAWCRVGATSGHPRHRRRAARMAEQLAQACLHGACLTWGFPGIDASVTRRWIGPRLVWWPRGVPEGERVAVISSRLGRKMERFRGFFAALRQICHGLDPDCQVIVASEGTSMAPYLKRCSELFQLPLLLFYPPRSTRRLEPWFHELLAAGTDDHEIPAATGRETSPLCRPAYVSPPLQSEPLDPIPLRDRVVVVASSRIVVCRLRQGGNVWRLLGRRLSDWSGAQPSRVMLAVGDQLVPSALAESFRALGAEAMQLDRLPEGSPTTDLTRTIENLTVSPGILSLGDLPQGNFLTHCTRCSHGPWPDQSLEEYLDSLVLGLPDADHSALATLRRIVANRRLIASGKAIRGGVPVVCFTAVPPVDIPLLHEFRPHRGRWDFEPYGISIQREWLERRGARPVRYGDTDLYLKLPAGEKPFFQRRWSGKSGSMDWSSEREWRHVGDVDLHDLPAAAAVVFVKTVSEAEQLRPHSRWPIVVMGQPYQR